MTIYAVVAIRAASLVTSDLVEYHAIGPAYKFKSLAEIEAARLDGVFSAEGIKSVHHIVVPVELVE